MFIGHLRKKIATHVRSAELKLGSVWPYKFCVNEAIWDRCPSAFFNGVAQYVHLRTVGMHAYFDFTCLLISFTRYLF